MAQNETPQRPPARTRWPARLLAGAALALLVLAVAMPGTFRLLVLQPPRDLLFFYREIQPLQNFQEIETRRPQPDETVVLEPRAPGVDELEIHLDVWLPEAADAPVALLLHGSSPRGRKLGFNLMLADWLRSAGWLVITPDARGYGDSPLPADRGSTLSWRFHEDLERLVDYALAHPRGNGIIAGIGHSFGGSQLIEAGFDAEALQALALIGPARFHADPQRPPGYWSRTRFASDRRLPRPVSAQVLAELQDLYDLARLAGVRTEHSMHTPVLLMDGELEGEALIEMLGEAALQLPPPVTHVTVGESHHYCGAYQLPWLNQPVFVRPETFQRCASILESFLFEAIPAQRSLTTH